MTEILETAQPEKSEEDLISKLQTAVEKACAMDAGEVKIAEGRQGFDFNNDIDFWGFETEGTKDDQNRFQELADAIMAVREARGPGPLDDNPALRGDPRFLGIAIKRILDQSLSIGIQTKEEHPRETKTIDLGKQIKIILTAEKLPGYNPNHRFYGASVISAIDARKRQEIYGSPEISSQTA